MAGRPLGASFDYQNDRMVFTYPDPMENELHVLRFAPPIVIKHDAFNATHVYRGNDHSDSCGKVYVAELSFHYGIHGEPGMYGTIAFPMWPGRLGGTIRQYRSALLFATDREGFEWLDGDVIPSW